MMECINFNSIRWESVLIIWFFYFVLFNFCLWYCFGLIDRDIWNFVYRVDWFNESI